MFMYFNVTIIVYLKGVLARKLHKLWINFYSQSGKSHPEVSAIALDDLKEQPSCLLAEWSFQCVIQGTPSRYLTKKTRVATKLWKPSHCNNSFTQSLFNHPPPAPPQKKPKKHAHIQNSASAWSYATKKCVCIAALWPVSANLHAAREGIVSRCEAFRG